jgi:hypothetical protein
MAYKDVNRLSKETKTSIRNTMESAFDKYRIFKMVAFLEDEPIIIGTADSIDVQAARRAYCQQIDHAVKQLHPVEQTLITERYLKDDYVRDFIVYKQLMDPPVNAIFYSRMKNRAMYKLAILLNIDCGVDLNSPALGISEVNT